MSISVTPAQQELTLNQKGMKFHQSAQDEMSWKKEGEGTKLVQLAGERLSMKAVTFPCLVFGSCLRSLLFSGIQHLWGLLPPIC